MNINEKYVLKRLTWFDKLCAHSIWPPVALIFAMMVAAAYDQPFVPVQRTLLMCFLLTFFIAIVLRQRLIKRIEKIKNDYYR